MTIAASPFALRPMTVADIPRVTEIERASFPSTWPQAAYQRELEENKLVARYIVAVERVAPPAEEPRRTGGGPGWWRAVRRWLGRQRVAPPDERVVGFLGLWYMVEEAHIVTVASDPERRRRGIGEMLVAEALELARAHGEKTVTLECRVSNAAARALYEKYGFTRAGLRKRYYTDNGEDAVIMTTPPLDDPAYQARLERLRRERIGEC